MMPTRALRCQHPGCRGQLALETDHGTPGRFDVKCQWCGREVGTMTSGLLERKFGVPRERTRWAEGRAVTYLWEREA